MYSLKFLIVILISLSVIIVSLLKYRSILFYKNNILVLTTFYLWLLTIGLGTINSNDFDEIVSILSSTLTYVLLFLFSFVVIPNYIKSREEYFEYLKLFFWCLFLSLGISFLISFSDPSAYHLNPESLRNRYYALFNHPNFLGVFSFLGITVCTYLAYVFNKKKYLTVVPFYLYLIYLSDSRTAGLAVILLLTLLAYFMLSSKFQVVIKRTTLGVLTCIGVIVLSNKLSQTGNLYYDLNELLSNRLDVWMYHIDQMNSASTVFLGMGLTKNELPIDNYYIAVFTKTGIFGLGIFLLFIASVFIILYRSYKVNKDRSSKFMMSFFIVMLYYALTESVLYTLGSLTSIFLWSSIGVHTSQSLSNQRTLKGTVPVKTKNIDNIVKESKILT